MAFFAKISLHFEKKSAKLSLNFQFILQNCHWHKIGEFHHRKFKIIIHMSVNFKPLADRVLVEPVQAETKTASGIIHP